MTDQAAKNRLSALSGFPVKDAMTGLATGNRTGKPAERKQEILTPQVIVDVALKVWGEIMFDPCSCPESIVPSRMRVYHPAGDGLQCNWPEKTYINPPYKDLKLWLEYGATQPKEQIWLVPVRTHRKWWREWRDSLDAYCEMNPLKFVGYTSYFPAPLLLGYVGGGPSLSKFASACESLGSVYVPDPCV